MERIITWEDLKVRARALIRMGYLTKQTKVWGVPRGGQYLMPFFTPVNTPEEAEVILDDLLDSGATYNQYKEKYPNKPFITFYEKRKDDERWYVFPWENKDEPLEDNIVRICQYRGYPIVKTLGELRTLLNRN